MSPSREICNAEADQVTLPDGVIRFEVYDISSLNGTGTTSDEIEVKGLDWYVYVRKKKDAENEYLTAVLSTHNQSILWSIDADAEFILVHPDSSKSISSGRKVLGTFRHDCHSPGGENLLKWSDLIDEEKGFIKDDKITVETRFWITKVTGIRSRHPLVDFSIANSRSDAILIVEGKPVHVNKQYLGFHCEFFHSLFFGDSADKEQKEFELEDVYYEEFIELLHVIYPSTKPLSGESVEYILKLAKRFELLYLVDHAENFLITTVDICNTEKLRISDEYELIKLQNHCLSRLRSFECFKKLQTSDAYDYLSAEMKTALLERMIKLVK